jgi:ribosome-associated translation inhibitor RaiA
MQFKEVIGMALGFFFRGVSPDPGLEVHAARELHRLRELAPTDSEFLGTVERAPDGFIARLDVYSKLGPFLADAQAKEIGVSVDQVIEKMEDQLNHWRHRRQEREQVQGLRDPYLSAPSLEG